MCGVKDDVTAMARRVGQEAALVLGVFAVASFIGALIWNGVVDLPRWQRSAQGAGMSAVEATKTIGIDAGFVFVAAPLALLLGAALTFARRKTPVMTVVLIALASVCAAALMERFGLLLGPANPLDVFKSAKPGTFIPAQLQLQATGAILIWPGAALLGSLTVLLFTPADRFQAEADAEREIEAESVLAPH